MSTGAIGALTAYIDGLKRTVKRNLGDARENPTEFGRMAAARMNEDMTKRLADPTAALDYTTGPAGGLAGVIRRGGRPELNMVHNSSMTPEWLARFIAERGSLSSPSVAIAKDTVRPFEKSSTFVFNPASPCLTPPSTEATNCSIVTPTRSVVKTREPSLRTLDAALVTCAFLRATTRTLLKHGPFALLRNSGLLPSTKGVSPALGRSVSSQ